jgi:hypothetical protein
MVKFFDESRQLVWGHFERQLQCLPRTCTCTCTSYLYLYLYLVPFIPVPRTCTDILEYSISNLEGTCTCTSYLVLVPVRLYLLIHVPIIPRAYTRTCTQAPRTCTCTCTSSYLYLYPIPVFRNETPATERYIHIHSILTCYTLIPTAPTWGVFQLNLCCACFTCREREREGWCGRKVFLMKGELQWMYSQHECVVRKKSSRQIFSFHGYSDQELESVWIKGFLRVFPEQQIC